MPSAWWNLGCASQLRYIQADIDVSISRNAGDFAIVPPGPASESVVDGDLDIMEIFVEAGSLGAFEGDRSAAKPLFDPADDDLRASAVGLWLAAGRTMGTQTRAAATFKHAVLQLLASCAAGGADPLKGGLKSSALRRINDLVDAWLDDPGTPQPRVIDLAGTARLSPNHFIRAFRETTGTTPYQYVMARRRRRAMALLHRPGLSISEVSDRLGFSSPAHFIASFRQRFGATPGDYREAILDPAVLGPRSPG